MKYLPIIIILGAIIFVAACTPKTNTKMQAKPTPAPTAPTPPKPDAGQDEPAPPVNSKPAFVSASVQKTACYGKCPQFKIEFDANGTASYHGKKHVKRIGKYRAKLTIEQTGMILQKAQEIEYFNMPKTFPENGKMIADFPMTITNVKFGRQNKTVTNNADAPQDLLNFENFLIELSESLKWEKSADE